MLTNSCRIAAGQLPFHDFWTVLTPGQSYFFSFFIKYFYFNMLIERIISFLSIIMIGFLLYLIIRKAKFTKDSYLSIIWVNLYCSGFMIFGLSVLSSLLFCALSLYLLITYFEIKKYPYIILSSVSALIATLFRHDFGIYALFVNTIFIFLFSLIHRLGKTDAFKKVIIYLGVYLLLFIPISLIFIHYFG